MTHRVALPPARLHRGAPALSWLLPFAVVWALTVSALALVGVRSTCVGVCAIYAGVETYVILTTACVVSAAVACAELVFGRHQ